MSNDFKEYKHRYIYSAFSPKKRIFLFLLINLVLKTSGVNELNSIFNNFLKLNEHGNYQGLRIFELNYFFLFHETF